MLFYVLRRTLAVMPILFGVTVVCFSLVHLAPGDAISAVTPDNATPELIAEIRKAYGYDQPLPIQYVRWLGLVLSGNLGTSIMTGRPVIAEIIPAALHTSILAISAICISLATGFYMGLLAGYTRRL